MFAVEIIIIGLLIIAGGYWQMMVFESGNFNRVTIPAGIGVVALIGAVGHGLIALIADMESGFTFINMMANIGQIILLTFSICFKALFGALFTTLMAIMCVYFLFEYGEIHAWNFVSSFFNWLLGNMPDWVKNIYYIVLAIAAFGGSIADSGDSY